MGRYKLRSEARGIRNNRVPESRQRDWDNCSWFSVDPIVVTFLIRQLKSYGPR